MVVNSLYKRDDLVDSAYRAIKVWMIDHYTGQSLPLQQQYLAKQFGMSKTPIREALNRLAAEGLTELVPNRGYWVSHLSAQDIQEIFVIREALEGIAARLAVDTIDDGELERLHSLFDSAAEKQDSELITMSLENVGEKLHTTILENCNNERMSRILNNINGQLNLIKLLGRQVATGDPLSAAAANEEHLKILEALTAHNPDDAEWLMRKHLQNSKERVLAVVLYPRFSATGR